MNGRVPGPISRLSRGSKSPALARHVRPTSHPRVSTKPKLASNPTLHLASLCEWHAPLITGPWPRGYSFTSRATIPFYGTKAILYGLAPGSTRMLLLKGSTDMVLAWSSHNMSANGAFEGPRPASAHRYVEQASHIASTWGHASKTWCWTLLGSATGELALTHLSLWCILQWRVVHGTLGRCRCGTHLPLRLGRTRRISHPSPRRPMRRPYTCAALTKMIYRRPFSVVISSRRDD